MDEEAATGQDRSCDISTFAFAFFVQ